MNLTWIERLQTDETLRAFVSAEIARAGIELDTLRWQRDQLARDKATLIAELDAAQRELTTLRRRLGAHKQRATDLVDA